MTTTPAQFLGGPFDGMEHRIRGCAHGNMPDVNLCVRVVDPSFDPVMPIADLNAWPDVIQMFTTPESAAAWSPAGSDGAYDVARYGWNDDIQMYVYAETVRRELHPEHDREDEL